MHGAHATLLEPALDRKIEVGRVDADEHIRLPGQHALAEGAAQLQQPRQMLQHFGQAHHRQLAGIEPGLAAGATHRIATDADEFGSRITAAQFIDQPGTQDVAGSFAGNQRDARSALARAGNRESGVGNRQCRRVADDRRVVVRACIDSRLPIPDSRHRNNGLSAASMSSEQPAHVLAALGLFGQLQFGLAQRQAGDVQRAVGALDRGDALGIEAAALEPFAIDAAWAAQRFAADHGERRYVAIGERAHAQEGVRADPAELMRAGKAADDHVVAHGHVAGQRGVVGKHAVVAHMAVVRHVRVGQHPVVVADHGDAATAAGTAIDGDEFADHIAVPDHQFGALAGVLLVLRLAADRRVADEAVIAADPGRAMDRAMRPDLGARADLHIGADQRKRADTDVVCQRCRGIDDRRGMNQRCRITHRVLLRKRVITWRRRTSPRHWPPLRHRPWPRRRSIPRYGSGASSSPP